MYLSADSLRKLIKRGIYLPHPDEPWMKKRHEFIDPCPDERQEFIEGSAYDLTLNRVYEPGLCVGFVPSIGIEERRGAVVIELFPDAHDNWFFETGKSYLLESLETITVPTDSFCPIKPRTSIFRAFNQPLFSDAHPGYHGKIHGLLTVHHPQGLVLRKGSRFAYLRVAKFDGGKTDAYRGIYGDGGCGATTGGEKERGY